MSKEEKAISASEEKARKDGWVPKEEWVEQGNDEESWVNFPEFNFRGELMDRIKSQTRNIRSRDTELAELKKAIKELGTHNKKIADIEYKKAIKELRQQKVKAAKEEDHEGVAELEEQIEELKEQKVKLDKTEDASDNQPSAPKEFIDWIQDSRNSWYLEDTILQGAATAIINEFERKNPNSTPSEVLEHMEARIREEFPNKFSKGKGNGTTSLKKAKVNEPGEAGSSSGTPGKKKYTQADLSEEQLQIGKTFEAQGALKLQEYVDQLAEMGELGG